VNKSEDRIVVRSHVARDLLQNASLFKTDKLAVWEYVVNSLQYVDPGINPEVKVTLDSKKKYIAIRDNGRGMDWIGLKNFFIMHGENIDRKKGKPGRGRFGTGKSAAFGIGNSLTIRTVKDGKYSKVRLNRSQIEAMTSGDEIPIQIIQKGISTSESNGTLVEISGIHLKSLDQSGIIRYIERHLARWPKNASVIVNNHECEYYEPPVADERTFYPDEADKEALGDIELMIKVSKTPLDEDLRGVSVYANGVWYETTLAGCEGREMSQYLFGNVDIPKLDEDNSPIPPYDLTRSMRLNIENDLVKTLYGFVGRKIDIVRRELVEKDKKRKESEEARRLAKEASQIAKILNEDFYDFRLKLARIKSKAYGGSDTQDSSEVGPKETELILGSEINGEIVSNTGGPGHGEGESGHGGEPPNLGSLVEPSPEGNKVGKPGGGKAVGKRPKGGFDVKFANLGSESARAHYDRSQRAILINLDHPQITAARGLGSVDEAAFRRLSYEVAFSEYAIALASELAARDEYADIFDPITDIRETLNRLARKGARLYS
jgi:hypothetical protein